MQIGSISKLHFGVFSKEKYKTVRKKTQQKKADLSKIILNKVFLDPNFKYIITNGKLNVVTQAKHGEL